MAVYGVPGSNEAPTEPLGFAPIDTDRPDLKRIPKPGKHRMHWSMIGVGVLGIALVGLLAADQVLPGDQAHPWIAYILAACVIWTQVLLLAKWGWHRRFNRSVEDRVLEGQAQIRTQLALLRAEMMAQLGLLPDAVTTYADRQATAVSLAVLREFEARGAERGGRGVAEVIPLPRSRAN